ncbi:MAG TPA: ABC transporter substrate-binding protein [Anaerolineae bacterium]|nr:ABC transporter substrate-binding protein [Anaerolineae bacterium]
MKKLTLLLIIFILSACSATEPSATTTDTDTGTDTALRTIRLPMGYIPDPQYAPFYVAVANGYYAAEGLEIEFDYSFETDGVALVGAGELPFAVVSGEQVILARAQGLPVVYVTEWFQQFPITIVTSANSGINTPADLAGRSVGLPGFFGASYVGYVGFLNANGLDQTDVNAEEIGFTQVEALSTGRVDAVVGYANNEPVQLAAMGETITTFNVADYVDLVANGLMTNEKTIAEEPELVASFVRATLKGLADTIADPTAAYETSKQFVEGLDDTRRPVLDASIPLWTADTIGLTTADSWQQTHDTLLNMNFLDAPLDNLDAAYTNQFVNQYHDQ